MQRNIDFYTTSIMKRTSQLKQPVIRLVYHTGLNMIEK